MSVTLRNPRNSINLPLAPGTWNTLPCGPQMSIFRIIWELIRNADSQAYLQNQSLHFNKICRGPYAFYSLRSTGVWKGAPQQVCQDTLVGMC